VSSSTHSFVGNRRLPLSTFLSEDGVGVRFPSERANYISFPLLSLACWVGGWIPGNHSVDCLFPFSRRQIGQCRAE